METVGMILVVTAGILFIIGGLWFTLITFDVGILWGIGSLFFPFVTLLFIILYWSRSWRPLLLQLIAIVPFLLGSMLTQ